MRRISISLMGVSSFPQISHRRSGDGRDDDDSLRAGDTRVYSPPPLPLVEQQPRLEKQMEPIRGRIWPERRIRRAAAACYRCHRRKVRCDAAVLGSPCTNCTLDGRTDCTLRPNATARFMKLQRNESPQLNEPSTEIIPSMTSGLSACEPSSGVISSPSPDIRVPEPLTQIDIAGGTGLSAVSQAGDPCRVDYLGMEDSSGTAAPGQYFLALDRVSSLPMDDVHVLVTNGSLDIPPKYLVDVFLGKYFLVIHPSLPILNEVQFWNTYLQANESIDPSQKVSLFVFQAMLLASCSVCHCKTVSRDCRRPPHNLFSYLVRSGRRSSAVGIRQCARGQKGTLQASQGNAFWRGRSHHPESTNPRSCG